MKKRYKLKIKNVLIAFFILILIGGVLLFGYYQMCLTAVSSNNDFVETVIEMGSSSRDIAKKLKENHLIRNETAFLIYVRLNKIVNLKSGTYQLAENMDVEDIVKTLQVGTTYNPDEVSITFQEGINMREIAKIIADNTNNTYDEVIAKSNDTEYINTLKEKYWFITDKLDNDELFYKLEGYLFPDTYNLSGKDVSVEYIFEKMLNQMEKNLEEYKDYDYSSMSIHDYLTLASMVEKESPISSDRGTMASVFLNRMNKGMSLGSDVTARYANKIDDKKQALSSEQFALQSPYNTRNTDGTMDGKLPVGPIATVSKSSIEAAFHPEETDYLFFISNIQTQETFFYANDTDFYAKKRELEGVNQGF